MGVITQGLKEAKKNVSKLAEEKKQKLFNETKINAKKVEEAAAILNGDSFKVLEETEASAVVESKEKPKKKAKKTKKKMNEREPILFLTGRGDRQNNIYQTKGFYILEGLEQEVKKYCVGPDVPVYNKLISIGLEALKSSGSTTVYDIAELEEAYSTEHQED